MAYVSTISFFIFKRKSVDFINLMGYNKINKTNQLGVIIMEKYVLVQVKGHNYKIGIREYSSKEDAVARQSELSKLGINLQVMTFREAVGA